MPKKLGFSFFLFLTFTFSLLALPSPVHAATVTIRAWGDPANGNPVIHLEDGDHYQNPLASFEVTATSKATAQIFTYQKSGSFTEFPLIRFWNDYWDGLGQDRNVYVDYISINGYNLESEDSRVYSVGSWDAGSGCNPGYKSTENLACPGYFAYYNYYNAPIPPDYCILGSSCGSCEAPSQTCGTGNGTKACLRNYWWDGTTNCLPTVFYQSCGINNCQSGYSCTHPNQNTSQCLTTNVSAPPNCTNTPINCDACSAPLNTCSTNNGTQGCTLTGPSPCTQVLTKQSCTINSCSSGYNCSSGTCVPNIVAPTQIFSSMLQTSPTTTNVSSSGGNIAYYGQVKDQNGTGLSGKVVNLTVGGPYDYQGTTYQATTDDAGAYQFDFGQWNPNGNYVALNNCVLMSGQYYCTGMGTVRLSQPESSDIYDVATSVVYLSSDIYVGFQFLPPPPFNFTVLANPPSNFNIYQSQAQPGCFGNSPNISINWSPATGADYYLVFRSNGTRIDLVSPLLSPAQTSFTDTNVQNSSDYAYLVAAYNSAGSKLATNEQDSSLPYVLVQTLQCAPIVSCNSTPTNVSVNQNMTWTVQATGGVGDKTYLWSGDESLSGSGQSITKSYTSGGTKGARVDLITTGGQTGSAQCSVNIDQPIPPTIQSLNITQGPPGTNFSGTSGVSGRQASEGGRDWLNSIDIRVNAQANGSGNSIKEYYVTFDPGFVLAYTPQSGGICTGQYCVQENGWQGVSQFGYSFPAGCDISTNCKFTVRPGNGAEWFVYFYRSFGSQQNMKTGVRVVDTNNLSTSQDDCTASNALCQLNPSPTP